MPEEINATIADSAINVTLEAGSTSSGVADDTKLTLNTAGTTYLLYNSTTAKLEVWVDSVKKFQF